MKKLLIALLVSGFLFLNLTGCSNVMPQIIKLDDQNAANTIKAAKQIMKHWGMNSAAIRQMLGSALNEKLPASFKAAMDLLDKAEMIYGKDQSKMTEPDAGRIVVLVGQLVDPLVVAIINQYAPDVWSKILKYLPSFLTL